MVFKYYWGHFVFSNIENITNITHVSIYVTTQLAIDRRCAAYKKQKVLSLYIYIYSWRLIASVLLLQKLYVYRYRVGDRSASVLLAITIRLSLQSWRSIGKCASCNNYTFIVIELAIDQQVCFLQKLYVYRYIVGD